MESTNDILEYIGMTGTEFNVYKILLKNEKSLASAIIKKSGLHRATVYDVLNRLIEKGLASYILINKKKYYSGAEPQKLSEILHEHKKNIEENEKKVSELVKELDNIRLTDKEKTHIATIYEGKEGLKDIMQEILATKKDFYTIGGEDLRFQDILPIYTALWAKERERLKIYARKILTQPKFSKWKYNIEKQVPKEYSMPSATIIYGEKVATIINSDPLTIIVIDNKNVAESYISHFNMLWRLF